MKTFIIQCPKNKDHDPSSVVEIVLCLTDPISDNCWDQEHGAYLCYADQQQEEEEGDDEDDDEPLLNITPLSNCLSVTLMETGIGSFVKYVSHSAPSDRIDIVARLRVKQDESDSGTEKRKKRKTE